MYEQQKKAQWLARFVYRSPHDSFYFILFGVLFLAVHAAVGLGLRIRKIEDMRQLLLDGGDAAGIFAVDDVCDFLWHFHPFFLYDMAVLDDIDRDVVIDVSQDIQILSLIHI